MTAASVNADRAPLTTWDGQPIAPGSANDVSLAVSESYSSMTVQIPLHIRRAVEDGPTVFVTAALHGDEINGTGAVRQLLRDPALRLVRGTVVLVPVLNILGFDRLSRYLPDRRDLNRSFPGSKRGSLASRMARVVFDAVISRCDFGVDLHTAAVRRTNCPHIRADLSDPQVAELAVAFGADFIVDGRGPKGSLRQEALRAGCPTIVLEGGEALKVEPSVVSTAARGVKNVLRHLGMLEGDVERSAHQVIIRRSKWIRAERGGFLEYHVQPGDIVAKGQLLATNTTLLGQVQNTVEAPFDALVIGMSTLPAISPGEPVFNLGKLPRSPRGGDGAS